MIAPVGSTHASKDPGRAEEEAGVTPAVDGRQLRRQRNRDAVVEALLDLYRQGNLRPGTEEIAARSGLSPRSLFRYFDDVDDLTGAAMRRQQDRVRDLFPIEVGPDQSRDSRVEALVDQRLELFDAVGNAATVARLRAPFQPALAALVRQNRAALRAQITQVFGPELEAMPTDRAARAVAAIDVLTAFEACQLLLDDQGLPRAEARAVIQEGIKAILPPAAGPADPGR